MTLFRPLGGREEAGDTLSYFSFRSYNMQQNFCQVEGGVAFQFFAQYSGRLWFEPLEFGSPEVQSAPDLSAREIAFYYPLTCYFQVSCYVHTLAYEKRKPSLERCVP